MRPLRATERPEWGGGFIELEPLETHPGPLCMAATRGRIAGATNVTALMQAPIATLQLSGCEQELPVTAPPPPFIDGFSDVAYAQLTSALATRFGAAHTCANPDNEPRAPLRYARDRLRVHVTRHRIDLVDSSVVVESGERAGAELERECRVP